MTAPRVWAARGFGPAPLLCMAALASCGASEAVRQRAEPPPPPEPACLYSTADLTAPPEQRRYLCLSSKRRAAGGIGPRPPALPPPVPPPAPPPVPPQESAAPLLQTWPAWAPEPGLPPPKSAAPLPQTWPAWAPEPGLPPPKSAGPPVQEPHPSVAVQTSPASAAMVRGEELRGGSLYMSGEGDSLLSVAMRLLDTQLVPSLGAGELAAAIWLLSGHCLQAAELAPRALGGGIPFGTLRPGCRLRLPAGVPASLRPLLARLWQLLQAGQPDWQHICRLAQKLAPGRTPAPSSPCGGGPGGAAW